MQALLIESLDQEGRGIARHDGKVIFVEGALPGEVVEVAPYRKKPSYELASVTRILHASTQRVAPRCPFFARCGGCSLQHFDARAQVAVKQRVLEDSLWHIGKVRPDTILPAIHGAEWGYRHRARLSARFVAKKGGALVGFHEKRSSYVADMTSCEVLPRVVSDLLVPLRETLARLTIRERVPQVEVAVGEEAIVLVLRVLQAPAQEDLRLLEAFAARHSVVLYLQPRGPDSAQPMRSGTQAEPFYTLPEFDLAMRFSPTEFTQVNHAVNRVLVRRALALLAPQPGEHVADLFCGIGNFTLAIARRGALASGFEGHAALVARAEANARDNGLAHAACFSVRNLFELADGDAEAFREFDRVLIDPPRDGAIAVVKTLTEDRPRRVVYVSCNPATLARDAAVLVHAQGYRLSGACVVNMFPHTSHVESIAVFDKD
ncbi:MAG: 23S rRNA (uracil(1939)-C(5))-methyltransferase [Betaproteobacteria bacterium RIFCSPLOWO2_02_64_14]|nr:MAG: 23S rRNA (uracil(1939)-C(5))-methyltransferase [Betaproteobacteria bacterium RIFCSPLOWO2_02_64_14]